MRFVFKVVRLGKRGNLKLNVFTGYIIPSERLRTYTLNIAKLENANKSISISLNHKVVV